MPRYGILGFDSAIQFLHVDDAVSALSWAADVEFAGLYNVSSANLLRWSEAVGAIGHRRFPILLISLSLFESFLERLELPFVSSAMFELLRYQ